MATDQVDKRQKAVEEFSVLLDLDDFELTYVREHELSQSLKDLAIKYDELSQWQEEVRKEWHDYFPVVMGLKKFVGDLPLTTSDLEKALKALNREEVEADARARRVHIQIPPGPPTPASTPALADGYINETPDAPSQNGNRNVNGKRPAENQAEGKSFAATDMEAEAQERPVKRVKRDLEEAENATASSGLTVETEGPMSLAIRISDNDRTSTFNLNGHGPAIVTVSVQKKEITASAFANGNKEAEKEGAA